ncbi:glutathione transferase GstA [Xenorhabdus hominickii]|uniref:Glutathione transferase GstA n=1 Tax=Xenorhabdus hominickii TaxID=351679 RepID=A0A2G0Q1W0_XENHO|nr:glutathione transferase GstA [Xenorhabdus hominickii]AOM40288.1 glutathione transferase GstA [Xenorhabdus hominickii]PHM53198.1 stringent starvation protein A [Xenorhabdus hominickii]
MKLYYTPGACSLSPHIILRETGLDFSLTKVDLKSKLTENGDDFLKINPKGQVPALMLDNNVILTEGLAVVLYLADQKLDRNLVAPAGSLERYHQIEWLNYIASEIHQNFGVFSPTSAAPESYRSTIRSKLLTKFTYLDSILAKREYIAGDHFTVADAYLFTTCGWTPRINLDLSQLSYLNAYIQKIKQRPHVHDALKTEGII